MKKKESKPDVVREINLVGMNESIHLMSTDRNENIDFLLGRGMKSLKELIKNRSNHD